MKINQNVGIYLTLRMFFFGEVVKFPKPSKKIWGFLQKMYVLAGFKSSRFTIIVGWRSGDGLGFVCITPKRMA